MRARREVMVGMAATAVAAGAWGGDLHSHTKDWTWLVGNWDVWHRRLKERLAGSSDWQEFGGKSALWLSMNGLGTIDDNIVELPGDTYRGLTIRAFDPSTRQWLIWWLDGRNPSTIAPPVRGEFKDGVGTLVGDDVFEGRPIKVRSQWSRITATSARWEQAASKDGGLSWETNWTADLTRKA